MARKKSARERWDEDARQEHRERINQKYWDMEYDWYPNTFSLQSLTQYYLGKWRKTKKDMSQRERDLIHDLCINGLLMRTASMTKPTEKGKIMFSVMEL